MGKQEKEIHSEELRLGSDYHQIPRTDHPATGSNMSFLQPLLNRLHIKKSKVEGPQLGNLQNFPLEIRQMIYRYVLDDSQPITVNFRRKLFSKKRSTSCSAPPLLNSSMQIRTEAIPFLRTHLFISPLESGAKSAPKMHHIDALPLWIRQSTVAVSINIDTGFSALYGGVNKISLPNLNTLTILSFGEFEIGRPSKYKHPIPSSLLVPLFLYPGETIGGVYTGLHDNILAVAFQDEFLNRLVQIDRGIDHGFAIHFKRRRILVMRGSNTRRREGEEDIVSTWDFQKQILVERVKWQESLR